MKIYVLTCFDNGYLQVEAYSNKKDALRKIRIDSRWKMSETNLIKHLPLIKPEFYLKKEE